MGETRPEVPGTFHLGLASGLRCRSAEDIGLRAASAVDIGLRAAAAVDIGLAAGRSQGGCHQPQRDSFGTEGCRIPRQRSHRGGCWNRAR